jgi:hypothetical protein
MQWLHDHPDGLPEAGRRSQQLASAYAAQRWADRWINMIEQIRD